MKKALSLLLLSGAMMMSCSTKSAETSTEADTASCDSTLVTLADGVTTFHWLQDNPGHRMMERGLFADAPDSLIEQLGLQDGIPSSVSTFVMHSEGEWVLFDTGLGIGRGLLMEKLEGLGLTADSISKIYLTHFHFDHIGGLANEGQPVFANAEVWAGEQEYNAWINEMPEDQNGAQRMSMELYREHLHLFAFGDTLPHGVVAIDAVGHTPGHTAFKKDNLLVIGDLMHGAALQLEHPEYNANFDMDKEKAAESRKRILQMAADEHLIMAGMHLPEPAFLK